MTEPGRLTLRWGTSTDKGKARDANEDRYLANGRMFVVADGMGGHAAGEVAAQIAIDLFQRAGGSPDLETLVDLTQQANVTVYERAQQQPKLRGMGTTVSGIAVVRPTLDDETDRVVDPVEQIIAGHDEEGEAIEKELAAALGDETPEPAPVDPVDPVEASAEFAVIPDEPRERVGVVNVGDSRVYLQRFGELVQLTEDHSLVETLVRDGRLTSTEARVHPRRNVLTRVVGVDPTIEVDGWEVVVEHGDRFMLCSDGLTTEVEHDAIEDTLGRLVDPQEAADELVRLALENGGRDNVTVIVVDVIDPSAPLIVPTPGIPGLATSGGVGFTTATDKRHAVGSGNSSRLQGPNIGGIEPGPRFRLRWRYPLMLLLVIAIGAGAVGTLGWYFHRTYYVKLDNGVVTVFQGKPTGLLWFKTHIVERTTIRPDQVSDSTRKDINVGVEEPNRNAADAYVARLKAQVLEIAKATSGAASTSTTTTSPGETSSTVPTSTPGQNTAPTVMSPDTAATTATLPAATTKAAATTAAATT